MNQVRVEEFEGACAKLLVNEPLQLPQTPLARSVPDLSLWHWSRFGQVRPY